MSVINQMLKDLDKRQADQALPQSGQLPQEIIRSPVKMTLMIIIIVIFLNVFGMMIWQLYSENKVLKGHRENSQVEIQKYKEQAKTLVDGINNAFKTKSARSNINALIEEVDKEAATSNSDDTATIGINTKTRYDDPLGHIKPASAVTRNEQPTPLGAQAVDIRANQHIPDESVSIKQPLAQSVAALEQAKRNLDSNLESHPRQATLKISRKHLSAAELTHQKISSAEDALANNQLSKAEKLFEDVLLVSPEHKVARKQLAALWFGRKSYRDAINLLSQGITQSPQYSEFRLMKARILISQKKMTAALTTLKVLDTVENVDYQTLLATSAQQQKKYSIAISAYKRLIKMEPNVGRWWLGLAVALDSNSDFKLASKAYEQVINHIELSEELRLFAQQRLQELGE
jgi:MSHA biogenesis protein MshN